MKTIKNNHLEGIRRRVLILSFLMVFHFPIARQMIDIPFGPIGLVVFVFGVERFDLVRLAHKK